MHFEAGDIVRLRSGGPPMTVVYAGPDIQQQLRVRCQWFVGGQLCNGDFHAPELEDAEDAAEPWRG